MKIRKRGDTAGSALPANDLKVLKDFNDLKDFTCGQSLLHLNAFLSF